jgi:hypothetical protein
MKTTSVFVVLPAAGFRDGERAVTLRISDGAWSETFPYRLVGPEERGARP